MTAHGNGTPPVQAGPALADYYVDLHIHIGRSGKGDPVKISGARDLTFPNIAHESSERKGMDVVGIIDCQSPPVLDDIEALLESGEMESIEGGGIRYRRTTVLLGSEIEVRDPGFGPAHLLVYMPALADMRSFSSWMSRHMRNVTLSSQRIYVTARELQREALDRGGIMIPAHVFTPHKSVYGSCSSRIADVLDVDRLAAAELGLSSDTEMAGLISELDRLPLVTNSDAHSLGRIGREYNRMTLAAPNFRELVLALAGRDGRRIAANYGLNPRLGKYHRTYCAACESIADEAAIAAERCPYCGSPKLVRGVFDRIRAIADRSEPAIPATRPPYCYQVPFEFIPGLGGRMKEKLLARFGTEMNVLHRADEAELRETAGDKVAETIVKARRGELGVISGGGGTYGRIG
ncbi:endonuclease Q family protein [Paenibacillus cymbidii]|uniref:endonuclease Q family protein n=1 Tax=Paenibacillus cymbidii TaxID=1639034 RepID=UPI0010802C90|nr:endonuclease Q family protein [Paenibacillus cymbidii]